MERIEPETETHRSQKALKHLLQASENILFKNSSVQIHISSTIVATRGGQLALSLMVNMLARMKSIIYEVGVHIPADVVIQPGVPLRGRDLRSGIQSLEQSITGPLSQDIVLFEYDHVLAVPAVSIEIGKTTDELRDIWVEADAWTAYINTSRVCSDWQASLPFGAHLAATLGVAEIFKRLLVLNFPEKASGMKLRMLSEAAFSALNFGPPPSLEEYPSFETLHLDNVAIVGLGAGGSAALYTLSCLPKLKGQLSLIEAGHHKKSNLNRYLLSRHEDCHQSTKKLDVAHTFINSYQPELEIQALSAWYADVKTRNFRLVISTVDTPEARWDIQRDSPPFILDAAVHETIYAILKVASANGMCLGCKHPFDPDVTWKRRAKMWGKTVDEVQRLDFERTPVSKHDIARLAEVQGQPQERYISLLGKAFDEIPSLTECGDTHFNLQVPNQAASLPFITTMAGILIAAEIVKDHLITSYQLNNWFDHDLLWVPKPTRHCFRPSVANCKFSIHRPI